MPSRSIPRALVLMLVGLTAPGCSSAPEKESPPVLIGAALRRKTEAEHVLRETVRQPCAEHRRLDPLVGDFRVEILRWPLEGEEPVRSKGTATNRWIAGGRFVSSELRGDLDGRPWERSSVLGYDRARGAFAESRVDSTTTEMPPVATGVPGDGDQIVFRRVIEDPATGERVHMREVLTFEGWSSHHLEIWIDPPGGQPHRAVELRYERIR